MVLKYRINGYWRFIDGITEAEIRHDSDFKKAAFEVSFFSRGEQSTLALSDDAYLMNDNGKTIQSIQRISMKNAARIDVQRVSEGQHE